MQNGNSTQLTIIQVPATVDEMLPPRDTDIITEAASFLRSHWDDLVDDFRAVSGEIPSPTGAWWMDETRLVDKIQRLAQQNGYGLVARAQPYALWRALRHGYKRNTGVPMWKLEQQAKYLERERRLAIASQAAAE